MSWGSDLTDYENWLLGRFDGGYVPQGLARLTDERWVEFVRADISGSDWTWEQYEEHVRAGRGDEWFLEEEA